MTSRQLVVLLVMLSDKKLNHCLTKLLHNLVDVLY